MRPPVESTKVAAITGAGRGIGLGVARACAAAGMRVAIGELDRELAHRAATDLGQGHLGLPMDVSDATGFADFLDDAEAELGPIDLLVNNAGVFTFGPYGEEPDEMTGRIYATNLMGVAIGCKLAVQRMVPRGHGHIVNVSSIGAVIPIGETVTYCAAKAGVLALSRALRDELSGTGVGVTVVMPGTIATEMTAALGTPPRGTPKPVSPDVLGARILEAVDTGRLEIFVPGALAPVVKALDLLPARATDKLKHGAGFKNAVASMDVEKARAYQDRVAREGGG
jgi:NAD(P)-dependent dehydrogenase (short-subunit alcohol dehydrogenase family)